MQITTVATLTTLVAGPIAVLADSCQDSSTSCKYWSEVAWQNAAVKFCDPADNHVVPEGQEYSALTSKNDDGNGGAQFFSGTYTVDGQPNTTIHDQQCESYMTQIFMNCGGYGGSVDTDFGTVSGTCIVDNTAGNAPAENPAALPAQNTANSAQGIAGGLASILKRTDDSHHVLPEAKSHRQGGRGRRGKTANKVKKPEASRNKADLEQHKSDKLAKQKQEEQAKLHADHQKQAEEANHAKVAAVEDRRPAVETKILPEHAKHEKAKKDHKAAELKKQAGHKAAQAKSQKFQ